jgi:hypothetical protein
MRKHEGKMIKTISVRWLFLGTVFLWLTMGCAASVTQIPTGPTPLAEAPDPQGSGWWFVRFKMDRPAEETRWEKDLLVAHRVASPLIAAHEEVIDLWRFHRRSAEDNTGHQFSFLFFTTAGVVDSINQMVLDDPLVRRMLADCQKSLVQGNSIFIFPEGTRSKTGEMKPFRPGAFILAKKMAVPILPVVISGTNAALPKHSLNFHGRQHMHIRMLEPIPVEQFANMSVEDLTEMVRTRVANGLEEMTPA